MTYYRFERGLGKKDIGIAIRRCLNCKKGRVTLYAVDDGTGKKAFACEECKGLYKRWKK